MPVARQKLIKPLLICLVLAGIHLRSCGQSNSGETFMTLLESARRASNDQRWKDAAPLWERIVEVNPVNGEFVSRLGEANYYTAKYPEAISAYKQQLELGYGRIEIATYNIACIYALMGDKENALDWLDKAFKEGFPDYNYAIQDPDLKSLHGNPRFEKIVARVDLSKLSRVDGWLHDLDLLQREIDRKAYKGERYNEKLVRTEIEDLRKKVSKLTDNELVLEVIKIMVKVGDGHSWAFPPPDKLDFKNSLPLLLYQFKEGLYVIAGDPKYKELLGNQVIEYAGIPVDRFKAIFDPYIFRDNQMAILVRIPYLLRTPGYLKTLNLIKDAEVIDLKVKDLKGNVKTVAVTTDTTQPNIWNILPNPDSWINFQQTLPGNLPLYLKDMKTEHWWELMPDKKTVYCQLNKIRNSQNQSFAQFAERLFKFFDSTGAEKLVLDMRWNNGGNTGLILPLINGINSHKTINKRGNFFVIIGRRTYSAAQNTATMLERFTNPIFVGEPTGSSPNFVGEERPLVLPYSKMIINVSNLFWQTSWPTDKRTWIAPTIYAPPTFESFKANRDTALEAIIEYTKQVKGF